LSFHKSGILISLRSLGSVVFYELKGLRTCSKWIYRFYFVAFSEVAEVVFIAVFPFRVLNYGFFFKGFNCLGLCGLIEISHLILSLEMLISTSIGPFLNLASALIELNEVS
jgi:hypothetical protein